MEELMGQGGTGCLLVLSLQRNLKITTCPANREVILAKWFSTVAIPGRFLDAVCTWSHLMLICG